MPYFFVIIALLVVVNFYMLYVRSKNSRSVKKKAADKRVETVKRHDNLIRKLDREQEEAARHVELRNKTLEMYEQVRGQAETEEKEETEDRKQS